MDWTRRHRRIIIPLTILVIIFIGSVFVPVYGEICAEGKPTYTKDCASYHIALIFLWKIGKAVDVWSALITALATVAIGVFTWAVWSINKSQLAHAHEVERAYLSGGGAFLGERRFDPEKQAETVVKTDVFQLTVDNYGKTPADVIDVDIGFCTNPNFPLPPPYTINRILGARLPPIKEGAWTAVQLRRVEITGDVIFGRFNYRDIFDRRTIRHTGFVLHIRANNDVEPVRAPDAYTEWT